MSGKRRPHFTGSEQERRLKETLLEIEQNVAYSTDTSYSANGERYPDHRMPFHEKHLAYIESHPDVNIDHYVANLKLTHRNRS